jgi:hypothetical protein
MEAMPLMRVRGYCLLASVAQPERLQAFIDNSPEVDKTWDAAVSVEQSQVPMGAERNCRLRRDEEREAMRNATAALRA